MSFDFLRGEEKEKEDNATKPGRQKRLPQSPVYVCASHIVLYYVHYTLLYHGLGEYSILIGWEGVG